MFNNIRRMDPKTTTPNILTLTDVSLEVEDFNEPLDDVAEEDTSYYPYIEKLPTIFTLLKEWPQDTAARCHNCTLTVDGRPIPIPISIKEVLGGLEFGVRGNMCSFSCARKWIDIRYPEINKRDGILTYLSWLHFIFTGRFKLDIQAAPDHTALKYYGGDMTEDAFKKRIAALEHVSRSSEDPVPVDERISTIVQVFRRSTNYEQVKRRISSADIDVAVAQPFTDCLTVSSNSIWSSPELNFISSNESADMVDISNMKFIDEDEDDEIQKLIDEKFGKPTPPSPVEDVKPIAKVRKSRKVKTTTA